MSAASDGLESTEVPVQFPGLFERTGAELDRIVSTYLSGNWSDLLPQSLEISVPAEKDTASNAWVIVVGIFGLWLILRIARFFLFMLIRGVSTDLLGDEELLKLGRKRWIEMMTALARDQVFQDESWKVMMSEEIQERLGNIMLGLTTDREFIEGSAQFIRELAAEESVFEALKAQITDTLKDENLHKAIMKGSMEAWKPDWVKGLEQKTHGEPTSPVQRLPWGKAGEDKATARSQRHGLRACG